jgi:class 3 adenylate cyclase
VDDPSREGRQDHHGGPADRLHPGIRTFLITDVRDYSSYTDRCGDQAAAALATQFAALLQPVIEAHEGQVVELRGDEALAVFWSARQAIRAAVQLQTRVNAAVAEGEFPLPVGIGLDAGEAVAVLGGFRGAALNVASRLCSLARGGEVLATPEVVHLATQVEGARFVPYGAVQLKGVRSPVAVVRIEAADAPDAVGPPSDPGTAPANRATRHRSTVLLASAVAAAALVAGGVALIVRDDGAGSSASGASGASASTDPRKVELEHNLVFPPDFTAQAEIVYMMPKGARNPPRLRGAREAESEPAITHVNSAAYIRWHERNGGVPFHTQTIRLVLGAPSRRPTLVTRVQPFVVHRESALHGWLLLLERGSMGAVRYLQASLDCPSRPATLLEYDDASGKLLRRTRRLDLQVSADDREQIELTVSTARSFIRWGVEITFIPPGESARTTRVTDPRLRVNGVRLGSTRTYFYYPYAVPGSRGRSGIVRTPELDLTRPEISDLTRSDRELCR